MEDSKRDLIQRNIDNLIRTTEYATLKAECMLSGLLFQEMIDKIEVRVNCTSSVYINSFVSFTEPHNAAKET